MRTTEHKKALRGGLCRPRSLPMMLVCLVGMISVTTAGAANVLGLQANIVQSACSISFTDTGGGTTGNTISIPDVHSDMMVSIAGRCDDNQCIAGETAQVVLKISDCGVGDDSMIPTVNLMGTQASPDDIQQSPPGYLNFAFRDQGAAGGTSKEFFVLVAKTLSPSLSGPALYKVNDKIPMNTGGRAVAFGDSGEGAVSGPIYLTVSCGYGCQSAQARAGTLNASLQFSFAYR
ncbi:hypothetical protein [Citrobacter koseri]|uniref:hypothetical protein n=1 Tax=Citrobacter koseri TaxID=545 RepID=UPI000E072B3F|nr:hypothetical protein [Citrobacter koseri]STB73303.1 Uncharacterised protein [Citrobacter koseri]STT23482.1 Uncharacterised protein [Citrobacter koseri]